MERFAQQVCEIQPKQNSGDDDQRGSLDVTYRGLWHLLFDIELIRHNNSIHNQLSIQRRLYLVTNNCIKNSQLVRSRFLPMTISNRKKFT